MSDLIDRQAAIDALAKDMPQAYTPDGSHPADEGIFMAQEIYADCIQALKELPPIQPINCSEFPNNSDTISRQQAIDALDKRFDSIPMEQTSEILLLRKDLREMPPIQPAEPKRGRWIKLDMHRGMADHKCSVCEQECYVPTCMGEPMYAFCPNCGSYNGGENEI